MGMRFETALKQLDDKRLKELKRLVSVKVVKDILKNELKTGTLERMLIKEKRELMESITPYDIVRENGRYKRNKSHMAYNLKYRVKKASDGIFPIVKVWVTNSQHPYWKYQEHDHSYSHPSERAWVTGTASGDPHRDTRQAGFLERGNSENYTQKTNDFLAKLIATLLTRRLSKIVNKVNDKHAVNVQKLAMRYGIL